MFKLTGEYRGTMARLGLEVVVVVVAGRQGFIVVSNGLARGASTEFESLELVGLRVSESTLQVSSCAAETYLQRPGRALRVRHHRWAPW